VEEIAGALARHGHQLVNIQRDIEQWGRYHFPPPELMERTFAAIDSSDAVLVEFSEKGVGLGIEAGYAHARGKPVYVAAREDSPVSDTLRGIASRIHHYSEVDEIAELLSGR